MTTDKVKEIVNDVFEVYYSEYMGQGDYNENESQEALDTALNALDEVEKYKKALEEIKEEITYKPMEMWDYRTGMTKALEIIDKHLKGVKS